MLKLPDDVSMQVKAALQEDIGKGDLTALLVNADTRSEACIVAREPATLCGCAWLEEVYRQLDSSIKVKWHAKDGSHIQPEQPVCDISGSSRAILTGERTALNFLQTLSATATVTSQYVQLLDAYDTQILDTRKTLPGLRSAQKYAVACGGGKNHRMGLFDGILIKENHIAASGGISAAILSARQQHVAIQVEVENLKQLEEVLDTGVDCILLDNFTVEQLTKAVTMNRSINTGKTLLEASGGVDEKNLQKIAATGVDYISIGALTKNVRAIDFSMRIIE